MANSADPDQLASSSGSTLLAKTGHVVFSKRRVNFDRLRVNLDTACLHQIYEFLYSMVIIKNNQIPPSAGNGPFQRVEVEKVHCVSYITGAFN